jgi:hypothetical protein
MFGLARACIGASAVKTVVTRRQHEVRATEGG